VSLAAAARLAGQPSFSKQLAMPICTGTQDLRTSLRRKTVQGTQLFTPHVAERHLRLRPMFNVMSNRQ
jgi:hypothetical protein